MGIIAFAMTTHQTMYQIVRFLLKTIKTYLKKKKQD